MFTGFVRFEPLRVRVWVSVSVERSFDARACMFWFPTTTSTLSCYEPRGLLVNTSFVYQRCVSVLSAF